MLSSLSLLVRTRKHTRIFATSDTSSTLGNDRHSKGSSTKSMVSYCEAWSKSALRRALVSISWSRKQARRRAKHGSTRLERVFFRRTECSPHGTAPVQVARFSAEIAIGSCRPTPKTALCSQRSSKVLQTLLSPRTSYGSICHTLGLF